MRHHGGHHGGRPNNHESVKIDDETIDEALELIWVLRERDIKDLKRFKASSEDDNPDGVLEALKAGGLATLDGETISFLPAGEDRARGLVRRYRLAERLFTDVFDISKDNVKDDACRMEHILSTELTDSVCTFLGHPTTCPHGKPIPRGECCRKYRVDVQPVVMRLTEFEVGKEGRIVFITPSEATRIGRLSSIGIIPGTVIKLVQRRPSIVLQVDETTIAIDPALAVEIFVKRI